MIHLLNTQHPRLFITTDRINSMKETIDKDIFFHQLLESLLRRSDLLLDEDPLEFKIIGPRMLKNCQEIHSRVTTLSLSFLLTDDKKYASRAIMELVNASKYPHWNKDHFLDTAELITAFAIGYDWLFAVLSEDEKAIIKKALVEKGLEVGLAEHAKNIWWAGHKFNWNQVCNGGLIIGALALADEDPELMERIFDATVKYLPIAFNSYGKDGGWEGGPDYWAYTTWYSVLLVDALLTNTGDDFGLSKTAGFDQTGLFPIYNAGNSGMQFNFADADPEDTHKSFPTLFWLGKNFKLEASINENHRLLGISLNRKMPVDAFNLVWYAPAVKDLDSLPVNRLFGGINAGYLRKAWDQNSISAAIKGGYNLADHAHLDLGTFVFDCDGVRWASDLGRDDYNLPDYFQRTVGGNRWNYFRLNTKSHNTLVLNDDIQKQDARAEIVEFDVNYDGAYAVVDLTDAYQSHSKLVVRTLQITGNNGLIIKDEIAVNADLKSVQWQIMTRSKVELSGNSASLTLDGKKMDVKIMKPENAFFELQSAEQAEPEMSNLGYTLLCARISKFEGRFCKIEVAFTPVN